jgi:Ca2+:H+ antiporter
MSRWLYFLFVFSALAIILAFLPVPPLLIFIVAALGIVPLAALIGTAVEDVAEHTGEKIGGLLFATFGNATELIIGILSLTKGLISVVSASIIGSILGNALLVLGVAVCVGGLKHGRLRFDTRSASQYASLLALSIGGLLLPTIAALLASQTNQTQIAARSVLLSDFIAVLLLIGYIASILFSVFRVGDRSTSEGEEVEELELVLGARSMAAITRLLRYRRHIATSSVPGKSGVLRQIDNTVSAIVTLEDNVHNVHNVDLVAEQENQPTASTAGSNSPINPIALTTTPSLDSTLSQRVVHRLHQPEVPARGKEQEKPSLWRGLALLMVATVGVALLSEVLVGSIEPVTEALHWNPVFVGLIFIPLIGGLPEYFNTISMALDKRIGMVLAASAGSSIQIALLMAPILVLVSLFTPQRLDLVFSLVELAVLALATFLFSEITRDGELVWLEGLLLILLYAMMGGTIFLFGY